jgi:hypothetical protein
VPASHQETVNRITEPDYDPRAEVFLPADLAGRLTARPAPQARILEQRMGEHSITAEVQTDVPAVLRIAQSWYPHWRATVDDRPTDVIRADFAFQAIEVPTGRHRVELRYFDKGLLWAGLLAALGTGLAATGIVSIGRRSRN